MNFIIGALRTTGALVPAFVSERGWKRLSENVGGEKNRLV